MADPSFDLKAAHRWFAVQCNNKAWDLLEQAKRTDEESEEMIHAAHASTFHWLQIGTKLNALRGNNLLATAYATLGRTEEAVHFSELCLSQLDDVGEEATAFDRAMVFGCAAKAYQLAGRTKEAKQQYQRGLREVEQFEHPDDREVFDHHYPKP